MKKIIIMLIIIFMCNYAASAIDLPSFYQKIDKNIYISIKNYSFNTLMIVHSNSFQSIIDYRNTVKLFKKEYGKPKKDIIIWHNKRHKENYNLYGRAILFGQLEFKAIWNKAKISLSGGENSMELKIIMR